MSISHVASNPPENTSRCSLRPVPTIDGVFLPYSLRDAPADAFMCGMFAAYAPRRRQREAIRRSCAMLKDRFSASAVATRFVSVSSLNLNHQPCTSFVVMETRKSSAPSAGLNSPISVRFVVGRPASGSGHSGSSTSGFE